MTKVSPSLSYVRVLLRKSSIEFSPESLHGSLSASSVDGQLPVKAEKGISRPIYTR